jgi:hypothetical protein
VQGDVTSWRVAFMLGMLAGALGAVHTITSDQAFDVLPDTFTVGVELRCLVAGCELAYYTR